MAIKKDKLTKISIVVLIVLLVSVTFYFLKISTEYDDQIQKSELEIEILEIQLDEILHKYDSISKESDRTKEMLVQNADARLLNDDIVPEFVLVTPKSKSKSKNVSTKNSRKINCLSAVNINVKGVKIFSDVRKNDQSKIQQLRVCYTLLSDSFIQEGIKKIYVQAVNPRNQIVVKDTISLNDGSGTELAFSAVSDILFNNKDVDGCVYVDLNANTTIKGTYVVNIYCDFLKIGTTTFDYR
ncbi:hypothetical protein ACFSX9_06570 [Flavobacterium ardleyense]|uniref:SUN domain-containing protein n=1 Tax=Flavobacterium ardleyense TaxID=2038737 RepID=A0ABW5Z6I7_9FLAO